MKKKLFSNKIVFITGGSRGIGKAIVTKFAEEGAKIIINYKNSDSNAQQLVKFIKKKFKSSIIAFKTDIANEEEVQKCFVEIIRVFGRLDILINNAGIARFTSKDITNASIMDFNEILGVNFKGVWLCSKIAGSIMKKQKKGTIINISSINSFKGCSRAEVYAASKAAVDNLTKSFAIILSPFVRVNAVAPGVIRTKMNEGLGEKYFSKVANKTPLNVIGKTNDIADAVIFLASEKARFITGHTIVVDGGLSLKDSYLFDDLK